MNLDELKQRVLKNTMGCESLSSELEELEAKLQDPSVWSDQKLATEIGQQVREIKDIEEAENPNLVKCVFDVNNYALYFSRSKIPYERNTGKSKFYGHLGIYGFKREALFKMTELPQAPYEMAESLEQLRALQNGMKIKVGIVENIPVGIDTMEDFEKFKQMVEG